MAAPVSARAAEDSDRPAMAELRALALEEVRPQRGGELVIAELGLDCAEAVHLIGCIDDAVVGFAVVARSERGGVDIATVSEVFVHPDARGVGVGAALLGQARQWALDQRCSVIESQVLPGNRAAKNFFERLGMVTRKMIVSTSLEG